MRDYLGLTTYEKITVGLAIALRMDQHTQWTKAAVKYGYSEDIAYYDAKEAARCANILVKLGVR